MRRLPFDIKKALLVALVVCLPLLSINFQRPAGEVAWYLKPFTWTASGVQGAYSGLSQGIATTVSTYMNLVNIRKDNRSLIKQNSELQAKLGQLEELKLENERLQQLLGFKSRSPMELLAARIIGLDLVAGEHQTLSINRGRRDGIKKGLAVITYEGVVGHVFDVTPGSARVLVLTDRYSVVDAVVQRSRARGIVEGKSLDRCRLKYLHRIDDVVEGDLVVTSGLDNIFPKGFPIGTVKSVERKNYGITQKVELQPVLDPSRIEEVFVVLKVDNEALP